MTHPTLDNFESALLTELRSHVTEQVAHGPAPRAAGRRIAAFAAAAAVTVAAVVGVAGLRPDPAFAVARHADGDVVITVMRLSDADGLEQALAHEGITAEVEYDDASNVSSDQDSTGSPACWPGVGDVVVDPPTTVASPSPWPRTTWPRMRASCISPPRRRSTDDWIGASVTWC